MSRIDADIVILSRTKHHAMGAERDLFGIAIGRAVPDAKFHIGEANNFQPRKVVPNPAGEYGVFTPGQENGPG
jgi:hypothetical protein